MKRRPSVWTQHDQAVSVRLRVVPSFDQARLGTTSFIIGWNDEETHTMEIQKNAHQTTSVAAATAYGDASRSCGCGLECATPMLTRRRDHNVDRPDGHEYLMIYVGRGKDNRAPSSGLLLLGTALRRRRGRGRTRCATTARAENGGASRFRFAFCRWRRDGKGCHGSLYVIGGCFLT